MRTLKRYTVPIILAVLSAVALVIGLLATSKWAPQQEVVAVASTDQPFTMTRAGVLGLYAPHQDVAAVRVEAVAQDDQMVWLAAGSEEDVVAWLRGEPYDEIVGLSDLETLKVIPHEVADEPADEPAEGEEAEEEAVEEEAAEEEEQDDVENPIASDMWMAMKYGRGSVSMVLDGAELEDSLLAATDGVGPAPTIILSWDTPQTNPLAAVSFALAAGLFALGVAVAAVLLMRTPPRKRSDEDQEAITPAPQRAAPATDVLEVEAPEVGAPVLEDTEAQATEVVEELEIAEPVETIGEAELAPQPQLAENIELVEAQDFVEEPEPALEADFVEEAEPVLETEAAVEDQPAGELEAAEEPEPAEVPEPAEAPEQVEEPAPVERSKFVEETVTTESGMMNLSALQSGLGLPTRRALREAERRGIDALVVGGRRFETKTDEIPIVDDTTRPRLQANRRPLTWNQLLDKAQSDEAETEEIQAVEVETDGSQEN